MKRRVLSIRGGGFRGLVPAHNLAKLESEIGPCAKAFDLIGGVSTGGILTCGLAHPKQFSAASLKELYLSDGARIFHRTWYDPANAIHVKFDSTVIESILKRNYGDAKLSETTCECLISAYDIATRRSMFFKRHHAIADSNKDFPLWLISRATSAVPTIFAPAYYPPAPSAYIDGGVFGTDPALWCWSEAHHLWPDDEIFVLSLGTGYQADIIDASKTANWGQVQWLSHFAGLFADGTADAIQHVLSEDILDPAHFIQVDSAIIGDTPDPAMDNASDSNARALIEFADKMDLRPALGLFK